MIETQTPEQAPELRTVRASEITPREVKWLWYPYIPLGKVTLLQGDPGDGKSQFALALAALLSWGGAASLRWAGGGTAAADGHLSDHGG